MTSAQSQNNSISRILQLGLQIFNDISNLDTQIAAINGKYPSFTEETSVFQDDPLLDDVRLSLIDSLGELRDLLLTPREQLMQGVGSSNYLAMHAIQRFKFAKLIPVAESRSYAQIAEASGLAEKTCRRLIRQACLMRIFREVEAGVVAHTNNSRLLHENEFMNDYVGAVCEESWPAAVRTVDALQKWPHSSDPEHAGYVLANGTSLYKQLEQDEGRRARYAGSMKAFSGDRTFTLENIVNDFDWASLGSAKIVDVGGSHGDTSKALARACPSLTFVVQDLPSVIAQLPPDALPDALKERITFQGHDIFDAQPVKDADVFLFRSVMIDWPDNKVLEILKALRPALRAGTRVLIQDPATPEPGEISEWRERRLRSTDLMTLAVENGNIRDLSVWKDLFAEADAGFEFVAAKFCKGSGKSMIEARCIGK